MWCVWHWHSVNHRSDKHNDHWKQKMLSTAQLTHLPIPRVKMALYNIRSVPGPGSSSNCGQKQIHTKYVNHK
jgi:hypothetical protein